MTVKGSATRPNIILALVDDMGFSDLGCYGSEIDTPNLDYLAANGVRFTQMYNYARCCPTRASLLTGLHPHQAGVGHMTDFMGEGPYQGYLNRNCITIAEALKLVGYQTYMSGKWHVGGDGSGVKGDEKHPRPIDRGFDHYWGAKGYFHPSHIEIDDRTEPAPAEDFYLTDAITDAAIAMIEQSQETGDPFFLHLAHFAPHWPLHALPEDIAKYEGRYKAGWDHLRTARHEEQKGLGLIERNWEITPRDSHAPPWEKVKEQDWEAARMAVYAAQVDRMDQGIGKVIDKLQDLKILDDTLVIFLSDNGACAEFMPSQGPIGWRGGTTPDGKTIHVGNNPLYMPGGADTYMSYDLPWANASDTPFRMYKHWIHEGGISTPLIVHWPKSVAPGQITDAPAHVMDIMSTCLDAAGASYPSDYHGNPITPTEGESLMPALQNPDWRRSNPICWDHESNAAVRLEDWKLVKDRDNKWELYDMNNDRTEMHDLSEQMPDKVHEMENIYTEFVARAGVISWDQHVDIMNSINPRLVSARWHLRTQYPGWDKGY